MEGSLRYSEIVMESVGICKDFDGLPVLNNISFQLFQGEILSIVGENGAGKSTLMKIISGGLFPSSGQISIGGKSYEGFTPALAKSLGIDMIHQENILVPMMSVLENIFIGREHTRFGSFINGKAMEQEAHKALEFLQLDLDLRRSVESLSVSEQQYVKLIKALVFEPRILIMDEPTSMFNVHDAEKVLTMARRIADKGIGILYISHFLEEVVRISDRILVLRNGCQISLFDNNSKDIPPKKLAEDMVGRPLESFYTRQPCPLGGEMLRLQDFCPYEGFTPINLSLRKGEILGIAGMVGSGRSSLVRSLAGAAPSIAGECFIKGCRVSIKTPRDAIKYKIAYITEDRQRLGLMLSQSITSNLTVVGLKNKISSWLISLKSLEKYIAPLVERLSIKTPSLEKEVRYLSGGNQQKVVLGKWLFEDSDIFIFDEPTRGIDINAKHEFYQIINELVHQGKAVIVVSSEMPEIISLSDRILVMKNKKMVAELSRSEFSEKLIIEHALGV